MTDELEPDISPLAIDDDTRARRLKTEKSRSIEGMKLKWQQDDRKELDALRQAAAPPPISEPRCRVCQSPHRVWIEEQLVKGASYEALARSCPPIIDEDGKEKKIERRSISNHYKAHMPYESAVVRGVLEGHAELLNQNIQEGVQGAFSLRGILEVLTRKAYDDAMAGITTVEPRDMIQMIKLFTEMEESTSIKLIEEAKMSVAIFMTAIQNVIDDKFEREEAEELKKDLRNEVRRLREQDAIEAHIENALRLPSGDTDSHIGSD